MLANDEENGLVSLPLVLVIRNFAGSDIIWIPKEVLLYVHVFKFAIRGHIEVICVVGI